MGIFSENSYFMDQIKINFRFPFVDGGRNYSSGDFNCQYSGCKMGKGSPSQSLRNSSWKSSLSSKY